MKEFNPAQRKIDKLQSILDGEHTQQHLTDELKESIHKTIEFYKNPIDRKDPVNDNI